METPFSFFFLFPFFVFPCVSIFLLLPPLDIHQVFIAVRDSHDVDFAFLLLLIKLGKKYMGKIIVGQYHENTRVSPEHQQSLEGSVG